MAADKDMAEATETLVDELLKALTSENAKPDIGWIGYAMRTPTAVRGIPAFQMPSVTATISFEPSMPTPPMTSFLEHFAGDLYNPFTNEDWE